MKNIGLKDVQKIQHKIPDWPRIQDTRLASNILNLKHKSFKSEWRKHSFSVRTPKLWNEIADSVRSSKTLNSFKRKYDEMYGPKHT